MVWVSYAQNYEDVTLMRALGDVERGFYVDVGANDPRIDSVTRAFYERGWRGINIEPVGYWHERLVADRPEDLNLRLAASDADGSVRLFEVADTGLSTADTALARRYADDGRAVRETIVPARRLDSICAEAGVEQVHFLKIDVEGHEGRVLRGIDLDRIRPWVIVVESTVPLSAVESHQEWEPLLTSSGYDCVWFDGVNRFYLAREHEQLARRLALPPHYFDDFVRRSEQALGEEVARLRAQNLRATATAAGVPDGPAEPASHAEELEALRRTYVPVPAVTVAAQSGRTRIFTDLRHCQGAHAATEAGRVVYALAALVAARPDIDVVCGLAVDMHTDLVPLASVLELVGPGLRTIAYELLGPTDARAAAVGSPPAGAADVGQSWRATLCGLLRDDVIAGVAPHLVWVPGVPARGLGDPLNSAGAISTGARLAISLAASDERDRESRGPGAGSGYTLLHLSDDAPAVAARLASLLAESGQMPGRHATSGAAPTDWADAWPAQRPRLALVGPATPSATSAAQDPAALIVALSRFYEVDLIGSTSATEDVRIAANCRVRSVEWFDGNARLYDRILYHAGASREHEHVFGLLRRHPGVVVLDDLDMSEAYERLESTLLEPGRMVWGLYQSHGWPAVRAHVLGERPRARADWPASKEVFDLADGVIVATPREAQAAERMYGRGLAVRDSGAPGGDQACGANAERMAHAYAAAIEHFHLVGPHARLRRLTNMIAGSGIANIGDYAVKAEIARAVVFNHQPVRRRQLLVDVTLLALQDARTGIHRVVRSILSYLLRWEIDGVRIETVELRQGGYAYSRSTASKLLGLDFDLPHGEPVEVRAGDIFLGLDWNYYLSAPFAREIFFDWRRRGVRIDFVIYDLLPLQLRHCVPGPDSENFLRWATNVCAVSDRLHCISRSVAQEMSGAISELAPTRDFEPEVQWFHLGADIGSSLPTGGVSPAEEVLLQRLTSRRAFLMVGTVEPRKGHAIALDAMERLWQQNIDVDLVIVGRPGWMVETLMARIRSHPEAGRRLAWLERASDEALERLYRSCSAVLMASEGEGFGLPLIEAAMHGLPIIARDLPVFREIAGEHAYFWQPSDAGPVVGLARPRPSAAVLEDHAASLASAMSDWLALHADGRAPSPHGIRWITWEESARALLNCVLGPDVVLPAIGVDAVGVAADAERGGESRAPV